MRLSSVFSLGSRDGATRAHRIRHRVAASAAILLTAVMVVLSVPTTANATAFPGAPSNPPGHTTTQAVLNIKVGGTRNDTGQQSIDPLAGVTLSAYRGSNSTAEATCISGDDGFCSLVVSPDSGGTVYTIKQGASVAGSDAALHYYTNPSLSTSLSTTGFASTSYSFTTPRISQNRVYTSGTNGFMTDGGADVRASGGIWQNSYDNPKVPAVCGLSTAILVDLSSSVAVGTYLADLKNASKAIIDALAGTPSNVALYSFGTSASLRQASLATSSEDNVKTLKKAVDDLAIVGSQYTNWDAGLYQMAGKGYDQVLVITDGNPTAFGSQTPSSVRTRFIEIEQAVASANLLKSEGTRIVAVGVGDGVSGPGDNLRAITGPDKGSDYFQTSTYSEATKTLKAVALAGCTGTVTVVKNVVPYTSPAGSITGAAPVAGWAFTHSTDAQGTATPTPANEKTDATGSINYAVSFAAEQSTSSLTITEVQQEGYTIVPRAGFNAVCTNNGTGDDVPVVNTTGGTPGFTVVASKLDAISCVVYNRAPSPTASIVVDKKWVVNEGSAVDDGDQPDGLSGQLTLGGTNQAWGAERTGYAAGDQVVVDETTIDDSELCDIVDQKITAPSVRALGTPAVTLASGLNSYTVTNYVTCDAQLTLVKDVVNSHGGTALPGAWTLVATPASGTALAVTTGTTSTVPAGVAFALSERGGPAGYRQSSLVCSVDGGADVAMTSITLQAEQHATCTFTNTDIAPELKLTKIVSPSGATNAANWTLTGKGTGSATVSGDGGTGYVAIRAGVPYTLTETPVSGFSGAAEFSSGSWVCTPAGGSSYTLTGGALPALAPGARVECVVTNTLQSIVPRIVKTAGTPVANADGTWTISYDIAVTNPSTVAAIGYDLKDTPAFGGDISFVAVSASGPGGAISGWTGVAPSNVLATGASLAANTTVHYTVVVTATVAKGAFEATPNSTRCGTGTNPATGGFLNRAVLTSGGVDYRANDCVEPVVPSFAKSAAAATSNANGTWDVTYTLTVTNPSKSTPLVYDLVDTLALAPGVVVEGVVVTAPAGVTVGDLPSKPIIVSGVRLAADTVDTYLVTLTVSVPPAVDPATLVCATGTSGLGLFNSATLSSGNQELQDDACASLQLPSVVHTKTVTSTKQESDGTWTIGYDIVVTNESDTAAGRYDLVDVPALGAGITVTAPGTATGPTTQAAAWNGVGSTALAVNEPIAAGATHRFTVTVHVAVAAGIVGTDAANCTIEDAETGTGFLNLATLTTAGASTVKDACSQPVSPSFTKTLGDLTATGLDGTEFTVTYQLTAENATALDLYYDLSDTLGFAPGVVVDTASVSGPDGLLAGWNGAGATVIATGRPLASGQTEVWTVTVELTITERVAADTMACAQPDEAGHGLFNSAVLTSGSDEFPDSACAPVPPQLPTLPFDPPILASTGVQAAGWLLAGSALVAAGLLLFPFRRRRAPRHLA